MGLGVQCYGGNVRDAGTRRVDRIEAQLHGAGVGGLYGVPIPGGRLPWYFESQRSVRRAVERGERYHARRSERVRTSTAAPATTAFTPSVGRVAEPAGGISGAERSAVGFADGQRLELAAARELAEPEHCGRCVGSVLTAQRAADGLYARHGQ